MLFVERERGVGRPVRLAERDDRVVEAGDADSAVGALERGDDRRQGVGRVRDRPAIDPRVDVLERPDDIELGIHQPAQADGQGGQVALEESDVTDDCDVAAEALPVRDEPRLEMDRRRLLLPLEHESAD